jgi:hypothetical protein
MENGKSLALVPFTMSPVYTEGGLAPAARRTPANLELSSSEHWFTGLAVFLLEFFHESNQCFYSSEREGVID